MAYTVRKPSGSKGPAVARPRSPSSYAGALQGFSNDLSSIRDSILSQQSAAIDYQIEIWYNVNGFVVSLKRSLRGSFGIYI